MRPSASSPRRGRPGTARLHYVHRPRRDTSHVHDASLTRSVETRPTFQADEVQTVAGVQPLSAAEAEAMARHLPLALAAYEEDPSAAVEEEGLRLLYHDRTTVAGERTSHYLAYSTEQRRVVLGIQGI